MYIKLYCAFHKHANSKVQKPPSQSAGTKRRSQVTGQVTGHRLQGTGHRSQVTGHRSQGTGHRLQGTGHRAQVIGHRKRSKNSEDTPLGFFVLFPVTPQSGICLPSTMLSGFVLRVEQVNG